MAEASAPRARAPETVVGIFRVNGQFYGLLNRCPHLGGPLCAGQIVTDVVSPVPGDVRAVPGRTFVTCPWHNWEFDIRTGQSYWNTRLRAMPFPVTVERAPAGDGRDPGPYQAETVPVEVEDGVLVLRLRPAAGRGGGGPAGRPPGWKTAAATSSGPVR